MERELSGVADVEAVVTIILHKGTMFLARNQRDMKAVV
jgi:ribosome maturation protein Sdo1